MSRKGVDSGRCRVVQHESSSLLGPVVPSFRALSGRLKFTVRRHKFNKDSLPQHEASLMPASPQNGGKSPFSNSLICNEGHRFLRPVVQIRGLEKTGCSHAEGWGAVAGVRAGDSPPFAF